jgi:7-cyano-7-deazaguanine synthase in queuosine biosynthesis
MKTWNVIVKETDQDNYAPLIGSNESILDFPVGSQSGIVQSNAKSIILQNKLEQSPNAADLLDFAISIYSIDQVISRKAFGFQGWSRHIKVHFPVSDANLWSSIATDIEQMLSFLSGDKWQLYFRQRSNTTSVQAVTIQNPNGITKVSLLSGGLDSFISAIDLLESKEKPAFVSHYKNGSESPKQKSLFSILENKYGKNNFLKYQFYVQPNQKHQKASKEDSSRARSFLFLVLGISVANALGDGVELIIPENGLISLNVPLTQTRLSSHSTRTTHPFYLSAFKKVIRYLGINNPVRNPYQFKTKGEMMIECLNKAFLQQHYSETLSCSHPDNSRFIKGTKPGIHCGYCVPCIIRQSAEIAAGGVRTLYAHQIKINPPSSKIKKGRDLRAFRMALEGLNGLPHHSIMLRVLRSGPLQFNNQSELNDYIAIYKRGMQEVSNFLH